MSESLDYRKATCARCGAVNLRYNSPLLNARYAQSCDHCGADISSGKRNIVDVIQQILVYGSIYFLCALVGVAISMFVFMLLGFLLLGPYYDRLRPLLFALVWIVGIGGGIAVAERSRRRNRAAARTAAGPLDAAVRASVIAQGGRQRALMIGFVMAFMQAPLVVNLFKRIGNPDFGNVVAMTLWVLCLAGGWIWGRVKYPKA